MRPGRPAAPRRRGPKEKREIQQVQLELFVTRHGTFGIKDADNAHHRYAMPRSEKVGPGLYALPIVRTERGYQTITIGT